MSCPFSDRTVRVTGYEPARLSRLYHGSMVFAERLPICAVTRYWDSQRSGVVHSCHIVDACLASMMDDPAAVLYDRNNRIWLRSDLHHLWDQRIIQFDSETGLLTSTLPKESLLKLGIKPNSGIAVELLTEQRKRFLGLRINGSRSPRALRPP